MSNLKCPYCGKKISYLTAIRERANGEHSCKKCKRNSTIYFIKNIKVFIVIICLIAAAMLAVFLFTPLRGNFFCIFFMFIPFIIFYMCIPFFIRFVPLIRKKRPKKAVADGGAQTQYNSSHDSGSTKIMNPLTLEKTIDPKGSPEYTRMIPRIRERKNLR